MLAKLSRLGIHTLIVEQHVDLGGGPPAALHQFPALRACCYKQRAEVIGLRRTKAGSVGFAPRLKRKLWHCPPDKSHMAAGWRHGRSCECVASSAASPHAANLTDARLARLLDLGPGSRVKSRDGSKSLRFQRLKTTGQLWPFTHVMCA